MPDIHLKYGGSTATRTLHCPDWPNISALAPDIDRESPHAARGTMLHDIMERIYDQDVPVDEACTSLDEEDREAIDDSCAMTEAVMDRFDVEDYFCEAFLTLHPHDDIGGSADMILVGPKTVVILDYKFGFQPVKDTYQFLLYTIAAMNTPGISALFTDREVYSAIIQPAVSDQALVTHHPAEEIYEFRQRFLRAVKRSRKGGMEGNPGIWCQYCEGSPYCQAKREQMGRFNAANPKQISELADAMDLVQQAKEQIKAVEAEVYRLLEHGDAVPGWKLVLKRNRRYFKNPEEALAFFKRSRTIIKKHYLEPPKLKSVAQIEKSLKKEGIKFDLAPMISDAAPGTTLAPEDDKRKAVPGKHEVPEALAAILK